MYMRFILENMFRLSVLLICMCLVLHYFHYHDVNLAKDSLCEAIVSYFV